MMKRLVLNWRHSILLVLLIFSVIPAGCSRRKIPAPPKVQPELLLELYDASRKNQYEATLQKIRKLRALDSSNIFLAELENVILYNQMIGVMDFFMAQNNYNGALNAIQHYETKNGVTKTTIQIKERLALLLRMDQLLNDIQECKTADQLEYFLEKAQKESQSYKYSSKIRNFLTGKWSLIKKMRYQERKNIYTVLLTETQNCFSTGKQLLGEILLAVLSVESPENPELQSLFSAWTEYQSK